VQVLRPLPKQVEPAVLPKCRSNAIASVMRIRSITTKLSASQSE